MRSELVTIYATDVWYRLRFGEVLFICALLLSYKITKLSVDFCVCRQRKDANTNMVNNVHGFATVVRWWQHEDYMMSIGKDIRNIHHYLKAELTPCDYTECDTSIVAEVHSSVVV